MTGKRIVIGVFIAIVVIVVGTFATCAITCWNTMVDNL